MTEPNDLTEEELRPYTRNPYAPEPEAPTVSLTEVLGDVGSILADPPGPDPLEEFDPDLRYLLRKTARLQPGFDGTPLPLIRNIIRRYGSPVLVEVLRRVIEGEYVIENTGGFLPAVARRIAKERLDLDRLTVAEARRYREGSW